MHPSSRVFYQGLVPAAFLAFFFSCAPADTYYNVSVTVFPENRGTVVYPPQGEGRSGSFRPGSSIVLEARPNPGWLFRSWDGTVPESSVEANPLELSVSSDLDIRAVFAPRWNFLIYLAADNDLERWADGFAGYEGDLEEIVRADVPVNAEVLILLDRYSEPGTRMYRLEKAPDGTGARLAVLESYGELDMSDPAVLEDFIVYAAERYPAEHTVLTLWNHGSGVYPRGIAYDSTTALKGENRHPFFCLTTDGVEQALKAAREKTGTAPDILHTDACLMQMAEIAWQWEAEASFLVGSPALVPTLGNDYTALLSELSRNPDLDPERYAVGMTEIFFQEYSSYSGMDLSFSTIALDERFDAFRDAFALFSGSLHDRIEEVRSDAELSRKAATDYGDPPFSEVPEYFPFSEFVDLDDFLRRFDETPGGKLFSAEISSLRKAIAGMTLNLRTEGRYSVSGDLPSSGLSVLFPPSRHGTGADPELWETYARNGYGILKMPRETSWDELLEDF